MNITFQALRLNQHGQTLYVAQVPLRQFNEWCSIPPRHEIGVDERQGIVIDRFNPELANDHPDQGYQRGVDRVRANKFAQYLRHEKSICPNAIHVNAREDRLVRWDPKSRTVTINTDEVYLLCDGQHRTDGAKEAIQADESLGDFEIPVILTVGLPKHLEMEIFQVQNSNQKGVKTDLVSEIMTSLYKTDNFTPVTKRDIKRIVTNLVAKMLEDNSNSFWHRKIVLANQRPNAKQVIKEPSLYKDKFLKVGNFTTSLDPIYELMETLSWGGDITGGVPATELDRRAQVLAGPVEEFWKTVAELMPETAEEPGRYLLQTDASGVVAIHKTAASVMTTLMRASRPLTAAEFKNILGRSAWFSDHRKWLRNDESLTQEERMAVGDMARNYTGALPGGRRLGDVMIHDLNQIRRGAAA